MEVPSYNKGRTVADVPLKTWEDGTRENLRPNTLWADERYHDISREEINAARERMKKRAMASPPEQLIKTPVYDRTYEVPPKE
jgi:hypothetical protein